ncbi:MAG: DUF1828 domain-containing protein [Haemophilus parainfluenzae]|nr:DUF1828 domain-containing protein [Haemophilus parainfluenzae]
MICNTVLSNLGYECHSIADDLICIETPFQLEDGSHIHAYIEQIGDDHFIVTDDANTIWEINSRGVGISNTRIKKIKQTLNRYGLVFSNRAEIKTESTREMLANHLQLVIQGAIITDTMAGDWYSLPVDKFENTVKSDFRAYKFSQSLSFDVKQLGAVSGHQITIPIMLSGGNRNTKQIFTTSVKSRGSWASAYGVLGKIMDLTDPISKNNNKSYIVIDDNAVGEQINNLILLFNQSSATILPYENKYTWLERLAA